MWDSTSPNASIHLIRRHARVMSTYVDRLLLRGWRQHVTSFTVNNPSIMRDRWASRYCGQVGSEEAQVFYIDIALAMRLRFSLFLHRKLVFSCRLHFSSLDADLKTLHRLVASNLSIIIRTAWNGVDNGQFDWRNWFKFIWILWRVRWCCEKRFLNITAAFSALEIFTNHKRLDWINLHFS